MNIKTLSVILSALAVIAACVFGVIHTNSKTAIANANAAKAENEAAALESKEKIAKSNERTESAKADAAKAAERRAESERKTAEAEAEAARVNNEKALADKAREEAELQKAKELRLKADADAKTAAEKSAAEKHVNMTITGEGFSVVGVRRMLHEIVYNLCDNAIKYNVPGGRVTICAENRRLTVRDTGIGIPPEHKDRIFERFYRVDKSHSKASGGTGLGLSIVKHAAAYHKAEITLESTPGTGTAISVQF